MQLLPILCSSNDRVSHTEPEVELSLQAISVPAPSFPSNHTSPRETISPSQNLMEKTYSTLPSDSLSTYQENDLLQQQPRHSISFEPPSERAAQVQSPPLQFDLHDAFLEQPRTSYSSSAACPIQMKPTSLFSRLSPIYSEGSPAISEADRDWMTQSHTHAGLHKVGAQQTENEISSAGVHLHIQEEEEELAAVGGEPSTEMMLLGELESGKLSSNNDSHQEYRQSAGLPDSISLVAPPHQVETELTNSTQCQVERLSSVEELKFTPSVRQEQERPHLVGDNNQGFSPSVRQEQERPHLVSDNDQGFSPSDETCKDTIVNPFEEEQGLPIGVGNYHPIPMSSRYMKSALATPHMLRSAWEAELEETQVTYQTQNTVSLSPGRDSHFLEDFID